MKKLLLASFLTLTIVLTVFLGMTLLFASSDARVLFEGEELRFTDSTPQVYGGYLLISNAQDLRELFERLGFVYVPATGAFGSPAALASPTHIVRLQLSPHDRVTINGETITLPSVFVARQGFLAINNLIQAVGLNIEWSEAMQVFYITRQAAPVTRTVGQASNADQISEAMIMAGSNPTTIMLTQDIRIGSILAIPHGADIALDSIEDTMHRIIRITQSTDHGNRHVVRVESTASLTLYNVGITREQGIQGNGVDNQGTFVMNGGAIRGNTVRDLNTTLGNIHLSKRFLPCSGEKSAITMRLLLQQFA